MLAAGKEALVVALVAAAPPLLAALLVGLLVGVLQAATQLQEPALAVGPRLAAVLGALAVAGPFMAAQVVRFAATALGLALRAGP
jgi:flagellar biosynthetic protein FliQ